MRVSGRGCIRVDDKEVSGRVCVCEGRGEGGEPLRSPGPLRGGEWG